MIENVIAETKYDQPIKNKSSFGPSGMVKISDMAVIITAPAILLILALLIFSLTNAGLFSGEFFRKLELDSLFGIRDPPLFCSVNGTEKGYF